MKHIPNIFTLFNLFFGCMAIVFLLQNGFVVRYTTEGEQLVDLSENLWMASACIAAAAVIDFLDGFVARLLHASSELGKQLDSLADVVSFGVAPSMIIYQFLRLSYVGQEDGLNISIWALTPAFFFAMAAAYRLGKFNLDSEQAYHFKGLPTPAAGLFIAAFPLIYWHATSPIVFSVILNKWFLYGVVVFMCWLMVSHVPLMSLKIEKENKKKWVPLGILGVIIVVSGLLLHWLSAPLILISYITLSLLFRKSFS